MNKNKSRYQKYQQLLCGLLCVLFCMTFMTGCKVEKMEEAEETVFIAESTEQSAQVEDSIYIILYMLNEDSWETEIHADIEDADAELTTRVVAEISEKDLNANTIVQKYNEIVVQSLYGEVFTVNTVTQTDSKVTIDFDSASMEAVGIVEGEEGQILYNLARSIDENLGDVNEVYLTMDGGNDFRLGHLWFSAAEPFYSGRSPKE